MWSWIVIGILACAGAVAAIYFCLQRRTQQRALRALRWIENSLGTCGHVSGMHWLNGSQFEVPLRIVHPIFLRAYIHVTLGPWPFMKRFEFLRAQPDSLTFHADLDTSPTFSMAFKSLRWFARSNQELSTQAPGWHVATSAPVVLTTRLDWDRDVTNAIYTVLHSGRPENMDVVFRRTSPNFSATLPLQTLAPRESEPFALLDFIREIAEGVSLKKAS